MNAESGGEREDENCTLLQSTSPSVGVSLQINDLGNGSAMVLQTHYDQQASPRERAALLDMLFDDGERLKARARIKAITNEIEGIHRQNALSKPQLDRAEETYTKRVAEITALSDKSAQDDADKHANTRRGEYKPSPAEQRRQEGFVKQLQDLRDERDTTLKNMAATSAMLEGRIAELTGEREELLAVVDAPYRQSTL